MPTEKECRLGITLSYSDQTNFVSFCTLEKNPYQKFLVLGILAIGGAMYLLKDKGPSWFNVVGFVAIVAMLLVLSRRRKKSTGDDMPWMVLNCPFRMALTAEGILEEPEAGEGCDSARRFSPWTDITEAFENGKYFYVFRDANEAFILPKEQLSAGEAAQVREVLAEELGQRFRGGKDK